MTTTPVPDENLDKALDLLLDSEGGWSNRKEDRGGATMYGVTQTTFDTWLHRHRQPARSVRTISHDEARLLYDELFWKEAACDKMPWPFCYVVFDAAVNSGPRRGVAWMQQGVGVEADGVVGIKTITAIRKAAAESDARPILEAVRARAAFMRQIIRNDSSQIANMGGWWNRTLDVLAHSMVEA